LAAGLCTDRWGELAALPQTPSLDFKGGTSKAEEGSEGEDRERRGRQGRGSP